MLIAGFGAFGVVWSSRSNCVVVGSGLFGSFLLIFDVLGLCGSPVNYDQMILISVFKRLVRKYHCHHCWLLKLWQKYSFPLTHCNISLFLNIIHQICFIQLPGRMCLHYQTSPIIYVWNIPCCPRIVFRE